MKIKPKIDILQFKIYHTIIVNNDVVMRYSRVS